MIYSLGIPYYEYLSCYSDQTNSSLSNNAQKEIAGKSYCCFPEILFTKTEIRYANDDLLCWDLAGVSEFQGSKGGRV